MPIKMELEDKRCKCLEATSPAEVAVFEHRNSPECYHMAHFNFDVVPRSLPWESPFNGKPFQKVLERITALRQFLSANTTSLDEKALFDSTISCFDTSIPHKILQGVICLSDRTYWKRETTTGLAHFLIYAQNQPCRAIKLKQLHIAYFYAANFIVIRKSQCASHCQPNSKGKALLLDDACISDVIPVKAGHETVDCELIVVTATFEPV